MSLGEVLEMDLDDLDYWMPIAATFQEELNEAQRRAAAE